MSVSSCRRSCTRAFMSAVKKRYALRPASFAAYIAVSACLMSPTPSSASTGNSATPIEHVSVGVWSASRNGAWNASRTRVSTAITSNDAGSGIEARQDHHELVAAQARDRVRFAHGSRQPLRDRLQELVARVVAERVVDALEVVEVEEQASDVRAVALRLREDLLQPLVEQRAVGQSR